MRAIATPAAPAAIGPYTQAIEDAGRVWCSGQLGLDPATGAFAGPDAATQARQALANLAAVLAAAGSSLDRVVKTTVFLADLADFAAVNAVYAAAFGSHTPARSTVQVARLPRDAKVEIEAVAAL
jgi:2-iminobutanoate/2-iminopropanoate deaminase